MESGEFSGLLIIYYNLIHGRRLRPGFGEGTKKSYG